MFPSSLGHVGRVMGGGTDYCEPAKLAEQVASFETRTMRTDVPMQGRPAAQESSGGKDEAED